MYMGELARLILVKFTKQGLLFGGQGSDLLFKRGNFFTKYVSEIERYVTWWKDFSLMGKKASVWNIFDIA